MVEYVVGADLPSLSIEWRDDNGNLIDFSTGWSFAVKVGRPSDEVTEFTKTTGITGAATVPNVIVQWSTVGELNSLTPGTYTCQIVATRQSDSRQRIMEMRLRMRRALP